MIVIVQRSCCHTLLTLHLSTVSIIQNCPSASSRTHAMRRDKGALEYRDITPHSSTSPSGFDLMGLLYSQGTPCPLPPPIPSSTPYPPPHLTLSPSDLCVSSVSSFLKNGVSSGFTLAASRGIHGYGPVHGGTLKHDRISNISPSLTHTHTQSARPA